MKPFELEYSQVRDAQLFVGLKGATLSVVDVDGQLVLTQGLIAGNYRASDWFAYMESGESLHFAGAVSAIRPRRGVTKRSSYGEGSTKTGANPDWRPRRESAFEKEMRRTVGILSKRVAQQDEQLLTQRQERVAARRAERQSEVVEPPELPVVDGETPPPAPQE